jgi:hypothetical protein
MLRHGCTEQTRRPEGRIQAWPDLGGLHSAFPELIYDRDSRMKHVWFSSLPAALQFSVAEAVFIVTCAHFLDWELVCPVVSSSNGKSFDDI